MKLFCVFQEGVYRHTCGGVFDSLERAVDAADHIAAADIDNYHSYDVFAFELNKPDCEESALYSVERRAALKKLGPHEGECVPEPNTWRRNQHECSRGTRACGRDATRAVPQSGEGEP